MLLLLLRRQRRRRGGHIHRRRNNRNRQDAGRHAALGARCRRVGLGQAHDGAQELRRRADVARRQSATTHGAAEAVAACAAYAELVADAELEERTREMALRLARGPGLAYAGIKRNLNAAETGTLEDTMAIEGPANARASLSHDGKEAGRAFMEKRPAVFRGY